LYILLDASALAPYYLPLSTNSKKARRRIKILLDSIRSRGSKHFLYIPNFCIAEVFSVFMKYSFGHWNKQVKSKTNIDTRVYKSLVKQFQEDIHNGKFIYHYELSRYHILAINLVAPIDHYYKITRSKKFEPRPMGTFDHLIISMGIHLAHIHGEKNVTIVTCDRRITDILSKCKARIPKETQNKLKLGLAEDLTGKPFGPNIFPRHINLKHDTKSSLKEIFQKWPLDILPHKEAYRWEKGI